MACLFRYLLVRLCRRPPSLAALSKRCSALHLCYRNLGLPSSILALYKYSASKTKVSFNTGICRLTSYQRVCNQFIIMQNQGGWILSPPYHITFSPYHRGAAQSGLATTHNHPIRLVNKIGIGNYHLQNKSSLIAGKDQQIFICYIMSDSKFMVCFNKVVNLILIC